MEKKLGKIERADFGFGGYQDAEFGIGLTFSGPGWGVDTFVGFWGTKHRKDMKWSEEDRVHYFGKMCMDIISWMTKAKVQLVPQLVGVPVEVTFDEIRRLHSWRVLEEVR